MRPERDVLCVLHAVGRRMRVAAAARACGLGLLAGAAAALVVPASSLPQQAVVGAIVALAVAGVLGWRARSGLTRRTAAHLIERHDPSLRNVVITAEELIEHEGRASGWMRDRVLADAARRTHGMRTNGIVPLGKPLAVLAAGFAAALAVFLLPPAQTLAGIAGLQPDAGVAQARAQGGVQIVVHVQPPAYTGLPAREAREPERLEIVRGTRLRMEMSASARPSVRFGTDDVVVAQDDARFVAELRPDASGYFAIEPGDEGERRLLPVQVIADAAPAIRIEAPGRDLLLAPAADSVPITAVARDDFGLDMLEIRYTRVTGSGEQFEFEEGTLPARVTRRSPREWVAEAELPVGALNLGPGDTVVYRAVGRDRRPGEEGLASSDTFFVEVQGRGHVLLEGLEMPPDQERYALSQQMIVLKIERLRARERGMSADAVKEEAALIAAEQRSVRANFIFLMGGHVEDEEEEAEHSHEIQEGRLENSARKEISTAIHHMTAAEVGLAAISTAQALPPARAAVEALQRAFGRNRYILRSLAVQSRIDPSRRLTGRLDGAANWQRGVEAAAEDASAREARAVLAGLLDAAARLAAGEGVQPAGLGALAEQALAIDPASGEWKGVSDAILAARRAAAAGADAQEMRARLADAAGTVVRLVQSEARPPAVRGAGPRGALERAWAEEVRR